MDGCGGVTPSFVYSRFYFFFIFLKYFGFRFLLRSVFFLEVPPFFWHGACFFFLHACAFFWMDGFGDGFQMMGLFLLSEPRFLFFSLWFLKFRDCEKYKPNLFILFYSTFFSCFSISYLIYT